MTPTLARRPSANRLCATLVACAVIAMMLTPGASARKVYATAEAPFWVPVGAEGGSCDGDGCHTESEVAENGSLAIRGHTGTSEDAHGSMLAWLIVYIPIETPANAFSVTLEFDYEASAWARGENGTAVANATLVASSMGQCNPCSATASLTLAQASEGCAQCQAGPTEAPLQRGSLMMFLSRPDEPMGGPGAEIRVDVMLKGKMSASDPEHGPVGMVDLEETTGIHTSGNPDGQELFDQIGESVGELTPDERTNPGAAIQAHVLVRKAIVRVEERAPVDHTPIRFLPPSEAGENRTFSFAAPYESGWTCLHAECVPSSFNTTTGRVSQHVQNAPTQLMGLGTRTIMGFEQSFELPFAADAVRVTSTLDLATAEAQESGVVAPGKAFSIARLFLTGPMWCGPDCTIGTSQVIVEDGNCTWECSYQQGVPSRSGSTLPVAFEVRKLPGQGYLLPGVYTVEYSLESWADVDDRDAAFAMAGIATASAQLDATLSSLVVEVRPAAR